MIPEVIECVNLDNLVSLTCSLNNDAIYLKG